MSQKMISNHDFFHTCRGLKLKHSASLCVSNHKTITIPKQKICLKPSPPFINDSIWLVTCTVMHWPLQTRCPMHHLDQRQSVAESPSQDNYKHTCINERSSRTCQVEAEMQFTEVSGWSQAAVASAVCAYWRGCLELNVFGWAVSCFCARWQSSTHANRWGAVAKQWRIL